MLTPLRLWMSKTNWVLTFTTAVWVINWVHHLTADTWSNTHVTLPTSLTQANQTVIGVADHTDGRHTILREPAHFARWQLQQSVVTFKSSELSAHTSRANHGSAATWMQLNIVQFHTNWDL